MQGRFFLTSKDVFYLKWTVKTNAAHFFCSKTCPSVIVYREKHTKEGIVMVIANNEQLGADMEFFSYLPPRVRRLLYAVQTDCLEEIRLRLGKAVMLYFSDGYYFLAKQGGLTSNIHTAYICTRTDIEQGMELITASSVYAVEDQIRRGFVTIAGGHRVGLCGSGVLEDGQVSFINRVTGLNYRFAHECIGVAEPLMPYLTDGKRVRSTLLIGPPNSGKTTMLRDIVRQLSNSGRRVSVADERGELAGSTFDLGFGTDVLSYVDKSQAMLMLLRSMSPEVLVTDEIGAAEDFDAIERLSYAGVSVIASVHGKNSVQTIGKGRTGFFDCFVTLGRGEDGSFTIEEVHTC